MRSAAHAYSGAAAFRLASAGEAIAHLDSAAAHVERGSQLFGFTRLWRARAYAASGDVTAAWRDLDEVTSPDDAEFQSVQLERAVLAIASADTARAASALGGLIASRDARRNIDTLAHLAYRAADAFGPAPVRAMLVPRGDWAAPARDSLLLIRAGIADAYGDTINGNRDLTELAARASTNTASAARVLLAQSRLRAVRSYEQLGDIRALLLAAITNVQAQQLIRSIRLVDVLVRRSAETGQPLGLFAAAEIARDELHAPTMARELFITFADVGKQTPWAGKALLAAIALSPNASDADDLRARMSALAANPYTTVIRGDEALAAYEVAEDRLDRSITALKSEAHQLAQQQETGVNRMLFALDSVRLAARADTVRTSCGLLIDTTAITGIRADSVRSACLRSDPELVASYLKIDTMKWRGAIPGDSIVRGRRVLTKPKTDSIK